MLIKTTKPKLILPHNFKPRHYQLPILKAMDSGATRGVAVWHRRAGKEKTFINYTAKRAAERVGTYFYLFPTYAQAKKAIWDGRDKDGFPFMGHFPDSVVKSRNVSDMKVEMINGSVFQLIGSDKIDSIMSTNPIGVVFAEYSLQNPGAWDYIRPILIENGGWAIFDFTPRGKNHGYTLYQMAKKLMDAGDKRWFAQVLTVADTGVLTEAQIQEERESGMDEELIQQEYYCSFAGVMQGAIFGKQMDLAEREGRITGVPWQPNAPVDTWWDIGTGDATAIWFTQDIGREIHVIDYYENSGVGIGIDHYIRHLRQELPYDYGKHTGPHDIENHSFAANGKSAKEVAKGLKFDFDVAPKTTKKDGIDAARLLSRKCYFDRVKTEKGRNALTSYHWTWDDKRKIFTSEPYHDWSSNGADSFRYLGVSHKGSTHKRRDDRPGRQMEASNSGPSQGWMAS
jgi:phage terminase large subunit